MSKDLNGTIMSWNAGAERLFGYRAQEAVGRPIASSADPAGQTRRGSHILERIRRGEIIDHFETVRRRKDGAFVDVSVTISPYGIGRPEIIGASKSPGT